MINAFMFNEDIDQKMLIAFQQISQAIRILAWKAFHLNPIQIQILIFLSNHSKENTSVSTLAKEFNITIASIRDTISTLEHKNLLDKFFANGDLRIFKIGLTAHANRIAEKAALYVTDVSTSIQKLSTKDKDALFSILGRIIFDLPNNGVMLVQPMCQTCTYHQVTIGKNHYQLLNYDLTIDRLQLDCVDHETKTQNELICPEI